MEQTLQELRDGSEYRLVTARAGAGRLEVGEFSRGPLTSSIYDAPTHYHAVHLDGSSLAQCARNLGKLEGLAECEDERGLLGAFFASERRCLADLMDCLDGWQVTYGYVSQTAHRGTTYRLHQNIGTCRPRLRLVD